MPLPGPAPRLYAILDAESAQLRGVDLLEIARALRQAKITWVQYRDKIHDDRTVVSTAHAIREAFASFPATLILNDRVHLVQEIGFNGVHLGQGDLSPAKARQVLGDDAILGLSTHSAEQARLAEQDAAVDYIAIGPVFSTSSKANPEACVGLAGVRKARRITTKPLVAIGGISERSVGEVLAAGADSVAVIGALFGSTGVTQEALASLLLALGKVPLEPPRI